MVHNAVWTESIKVAVVVSQALWVEANLTAVDTKLAAKPMLRESPLEA